MRIFHTVILFLLFTLISISSKAQCFEIQSILVDACDGTNEGKNEMVTFKVGTSALNTSNLSANWPSNNWLGLTKNATTAAAVASINATILGCGFLKEPVGGVLPANSKVLLITSTAFNVSAQTFVGLTDTLIIIFQTAGNTGGHFGNYQSGGGTRTLSMTFSGPGGCTDVVTYNRALLVTQAGLAGAEDGATVEFTPAGVATYVNYGCQAPYIALNVDAGPNKTICANSTQTFTASASGDYTSVIWTTGSGASGSFLPANTLATTYSASATDNGTIKLYCTITKTCSSQSTTKKDSVLLTITGSPTVALSSNSITICAGQTATVQATSSAATSYSWSNGQLTGLLSTNAAGVYTVNASNNCGSAVANVTVFTSGTTPTIQVSSSTPTICSGQTATLSLTASGGNYTWSTGSNATSIIINQAGIYTASVSNSCGLASASVSITTIANPTVTISASNTLICNGQSVTLTASSNATFFEWDNGLQTYTNVVTNSGIQTVTVSNICATATASISITQTSLPVLNLTASSTTICPNQTATLTVSGGNSPYTWSNSLNTNSEVTSTGGTVSVSNTNACGTVTQTITITIIPITAAFNVNPSVGISPLIVNFTNNSVGADTFNWNFGNGENATTQNVNSQTYIEPGTYTISLTVSNGLCIDVAVNTVEVLADAPTLYIPNAFTPNGDKINDVFFVKGTNIKEFSMIIFDRWGLEMFISNDIDAGWDGKIKGTMTSDGTYFYLVKARGTDREEINKQGTVTLFK